MTASPVIAKSSVAKEVWQSENALEKRISGKVVSEEDEIGLPGVNIVVKGTTRGTTTDVNGEYRITVPDDAVLVFSYLGFVPEEVPVGNSTTINVTLVPDISSLSEVVVVGYGSQSKRELTSAISSISAEEIKEMPVVGLDQSIQEEHPEWWLSIIPANPAAVLPCASGARHSIGSGSDPLFVIDGIPMTMPRRLT